MHRFLLNKHDIQSTSMLQIVHSNVWGPTLISYLFGYFYYVVSLIITLGIPGSFYLNKNLSCLLCLSILRIWLKLITLLKSKYLGLIMVESILILSFKVFVLNGILHQTSFPHVPQQNGVLKRKHRHIVEIGLAMLYQSHLPMNFWSYAFSTASFLINRLSSSILGFISP